MRKLLFTVREGYSCFIGLGILIVMMPLNNLVGRYVVNNQSKIMKISDERISLMNEVGAYIYPNEYSCSVGR